MSEVINSATGDRLAEIRAAGRSALVGYLPLGYPTVEQSVAAAKAMVEAGVDIVELGLPYSDPVMDGAVIQDAVDQSLAQGTRVRDVFGAVEAIAESGAPVLVMTYFNPVLRYGVEGFARDLSSAGGCGLITPDLIPDEADEWIAASDNHSLDRVFLVAPSSTPERLELTAKASRGFVYAASTMGITGTRASVGDHAAQLVSDTHAAGAENVCVGLGVSNGKQASEIAAFADGVIVGSALVRTLAGPEVGEGDFSELRKLAGELAEGVRR